MVDITKPITVRPDDEYRVSVSAHIQSFRYAVTRYAPDGQGGFLDGKVIAEGSNDNSQWVGKGADIRGSIIQVCVTHGGHTPTSMYEIVARLQIEHANGMVEDVTTIRIAPGLASGDYKCMALQFQ
jgi:hypothetical protein